MEDVRRLVIIILGLATSIAASVLVMTQGWGLEPKSWGWILGVGFFGQIFAHALVALGKVENK